MSELIIRGGHPISGTHRTPGNKNAALPMLAACVLTDEPVTLRNLPLIRDVQTMLDILADLGASVDLHGHTATVCCKGLRKHVLSDALCRQARSSILFAGPMVARHGRVKVSHPGGDVIGRRRIDTHIDGLSQLGVDIETLDQYVFKRSDSFHGTAILLDEASVTATENILMAAVLAPGESVIYNAACEPHVQDLCRLLTRMGAHIEGIGTNRLSVNGVDTLHGATHRLASDYVEAASFVAAAVLTGGGLRIENIDPSDFLVIGKHFGRLGITLNMAEDSLYVPPQQRLEIRDDIGAAIPKLEDGTWPNFPSDLMSVSIVLATQAKGTMLFFEKMFESRMYFVDRLIEMGARIVQCDPHRVVISGPSRLQGTSMSSPDIRAGVSLLLAALCASGESHIGNAHIIDRGYENVDRELRRLGADIRRVGSK
ncbi:MAG TPA: UDP-N-acetylglucosamine 1-carboxyvinyltransferase [Verrucomicrobia bacterium]|nr:UDP-N-acetylglucosamine 1-carboxyvinyltransferase [Verrucomicrobiota bacterium]